MGKKFPINFVDMADFFLSGGEMGKNIQKYLEKMFAGEHTYLEYPDFPWLLSTSLRKHRCPTKTLEINHKTQPENRRICVSNNITIVYCVYHIYHIVSYACIRTIYGMCTCAIQQDVKV